MPDTFIDIAIWFTIIILSFNVLAMWVDTNTVNPHLSITGFEQGNLATFTDANLPTDVNGINVIGTDVSQISTTQQDKVSSYQTNIFVFLYNLLFMWQTVLMSIFPESAAIIGVFLTGIIGMIEITGIFALLMRAAVAIGALIPFT